MLHQSVMAEIKKETHTRKQLVEQNNISLNVYFIQICFTGYHKICLLTLMMYIYIYIYIYTSENKQKNIKNYVY